MESLANKYRPKTFDQLIGQDHLVETLTYAITRKKIPQSIVLTGIHGIGKTTTARVIARALNCESSSEPTTTPCLKCEQCLAIDQDRHPDVIEIDAASYASVDAARNQVAGLGTMPMMGRWRERIIDEAHGMSDRAWDVWLKSIEEPPPREMFIFATTEGQNIPSTIKSRSHVFTLPPVSVELIAKHLSEIAQKENIKIDDSGCQTIAYIADGSVRDAISLLEQSSNRSSEKAITGDNIRTLLSLPDGNMIAQTLLTFYHDKASGIKMLQDIFASGSSAIGVLRSSMNCLYYARLACVDPEILQSTPTSPQERKTCIALANEARPVLGKMWQNLSNISSILRDSPMPKETITLAILSSLEG